MRSPDFSGATLKHSDVVVRRGYDPSVRNDVEDPSGFNQFSQTAGDGFLQAVRDTYVQEANRAPRILREHAPRAFDVYLNYTDTAPADAIVLSGKQKMTFDASTCLPLHFELTEPKGLGFKVDDLNITSRLIGKMEHECRHLLTRLGMHMFNVGPDEALIAGLDRHYNPQDRQAYIPLEIARELCVSTSGLNTPTDFGCVHYSHKAQEAVYLAAHCALEDIHIDQIWKIWELLTDIALRHRRYPLQAEVRRTISEVLQDKADAILRSPAFEPMTAGTHVAAFRTPTNTPGNSVEFLAFSAEKNACFGLRKTPQGWAYDDVALHCADTYAPASNIFFHDQGGKRIPHAQGSGKFESGAYGTSFEKVAEHLRLQLGKQGEEFLKTVGSMEIQTAGLPPFTLLPPKESSAR